MTQRKALLAIHLGALLFGNELYGAPVYPVDLRRIGGLALLGVGAALVAIK